MDYLTSAQVLTSTVCDKLPPSGVLVNCSPTVCRGVVDHATALAVSPPLANGVFPCVAPMLAACELYNVWVLVTVVMICAAAV